MNVLGLAYGFHDSSAALVQKGLLVAASSEERFTRQKHDSFFPRFAIENCLKTAGLESKNLDLVVFYESTPKKFTRILSSTMKNWPFNRKEFTQSMKAWLGSKLWTMNQIVHHLKMDPSKVISIQHHEAHAYQAFMGSNFSESAILTVDAVGEWSTTGLWKAQWIDGKPKLTLIVETDYPHSLGLFYSAMTSFLGFKPMNDECTTMALAAFGKPRFSDFFRSVVKVQAGQVWLDPDCFQFDQFFQIPFQKKLIEQIGLPAKDSKLSFSNFEKKIVSDDEQRLADIAASVQYIFEEKMLELANFLKQKTGSSNLCLAGGAGLNCVANTRLVKESGFENIFIPIDPGDGGASVGAAFAGYFLKSQSSPDQSYYRANVGHQKIDEIAFAEMIKLIKVNQTKKFAKFSQADVTDWDVKKYENTADFLEALSNEIENYQIVGWFQGNHEFGPRALGHRSILIRPDHLGLAHRLSSGVKERAAFRPYALSMTEKAAAAILNLEEGLLKQRPMQWMQLAIETKVEAHIRIKAGIHIDGTTRPQLVLAHDSPLFHELLETYEKTTGLSCLLNTSFNESGYPIVRTPMEALLMFARTDMDLLAVGQTIVKKVRTPHVR